MRLRVLESIGEIPAPEWNALADGANPFLRHEFLHAMESTGCACPNTGWQPRHLVVQARDNGRTRLLGAVPLYLKDHSYGEFVFDWAWADAYARSGLAYYPKLVAAVPFSPVTGPRVLLGQHAEPERVATLLIDGARALADESAASSLHWLFTTETDTRRLEHHGFVRRIGYQFHWHNRGYRDFDDFLSTFSAEKRKKVRRERRFVREAGITTEILNGRDITSAHWDRLYEFHHVTIRNHGAAPYLTREFFHALGAAMAPQAVLVFARRGSEWIGGALNLRGHDALYGRYWGSSGDFHSLHFEVCYYSAIEYCIAQGLTRFEAGAQGEHKLARGFVPTPTYSVHWLRHPRFFGAVAEFVARERIGVEDYMHELNVHVPYKDPPLE